MQMWDMCAEDNSDILVYKYTYSFSSVVDKEWHSVRTVTHNPSCSLFQQMGIGLWPISHTSPLDDTH